jgi:hypothetical protein
MNDLRAPFPWFGGKTLASPMIWRAFGNVPNYVEPFAGSLAVLLSRPHAPKVETVNDKDGFIANFWRAVKHAPDEVAQWCDWPVNEADLHARHRWLVHKGVPLLERLIDDPDFYDARIAGWWCWGVCTWIGNGWCHKDERVQKQKRRPELNAANGRGVNAIGKVSEPQKRRPQLSNANGQGVIARSGPISVPQYLQLPKVGTPGHGIHAPGRKMPRNARGATGIHQVATGKKPLTHRGKGVHKSSYQNEGILEVFAGLSERLRYVRVCCGDWTRVMGRSTLGIDTDHGMTPCGIVLDPPYAHDLRDKRLYREDAAGVSDEVREWALENGDNPALRIALCGQVGEHKMPKSWTEIAWASTSSAVSRTKERIWFSPHCYNAIVQQDLFAGLVAS